MPTTGKGERHWKLADWEARLVGEPAPGVFTNADLTGLPPSLTQLSRTVATEHVPAAMARRSVGARRTANSLGRRHE